MKMLTNVLPSLLTAILLIYPIQAAAYVTTASAQAQSCGGTFNDSDGAVGQDSASATASSAGDCGDGSSSSATANAATSIAAGQVTVDGEGTGFQEFNGSFTQATFSERLTIENVPAGIDNVDIRVVIAFVGVPPAPAFYNSASMDGSVNPQGIPGQVSLSGCSGDLCAGAPGPVRTETLEQVVTLPRNGLGTFGFIDVFMDARFAIADASSAINGVVTVDILGIPEATLVSESGVFGGADTDNDGVPDASDNCTLEPNSTQLDTNGDGFGNACDPDLDNNGVVNFLDIGIFAMAFLSVGILDADFNGDGVVNFIDYAVFAPYFLGPPGPSGLMP